MAYEIEDDIMPLFLINGFLEAGKTQFLDFTIQQDYFKTEGDPSHCVGGRRYGV